MPCRTGAGAENGQNWLGTRAIGSKERIVGQQQLLLLILGILLVGIALAAGIAHLGANNIRANEDGLSNSLAAIASDALRYRNTPASDRGGNRSFRNYVIPADRHQDDYGDYSVADTLHGQTIIIIGRSSFDTSWIAACLEDSAGHLSFRFDGW